MIPDFENIKPLIIAEFDAVMSKYPTDMSMIEERIPKTGSALEKKLSIIEAAAELCPVHIFPHFPFACEVDTGVPRDMTYYGVGRLLRRHLDIDLSPLEASRDRLWHMKLGRFNDYTDYYHHTIDFDRLFEKGFRGIENDCLKLNEPELSLPEEKRSEAFHYRETLIRVCRAIKKLGERLKERAAELLPSASDELARHNLERIVNSANTPYDPPETLCDAFNAILCADQFISELDGISMNSQGQVDRLCMPYLAKDLENGIIDEKEAVYLVRCFLSKTDLHANFAAGRTLFDSSVTVMIGGCDEAGEPVYNRLTDMILDAYEDGNYINPKLNARASTASPHPYIKRIAKLMALGKNNVIIENDGYVIPMFLRMGVKPTDAARYIGGGCQEVVCPNQLHSRASVYMSLPQVLLDTISKGRGEERIKDADHAEIYQYGASDISDFDRLEASFLANLRSYIRVLSDLFKPYVLLHGDINPTPLLSCFVGGCVRKGRDASSGGADYYANTIALFGFGTLCDSLLALRAAYREGRVNELIDACESDFSGDKNEKLRRQILRSDEHFGGSDDADNYAASLADKLAKVADGLKNALGVEWHTSLFAFYLFESVGKSTGATPDGRHAGEPLSRGMNMGHIDSLTSAAVSLSKICGAEFNDVGVFDFVLPSSPSKGSDSIDAVTAFLMACIRLNIPVMQSNVIDKERLDAEKKRLQEQKDAVPDPELIVRVCGYSAIFGLLDPTIQNEILERSTC